MKVITINKKATVRDYARLAARRSPVINNFALGAALGSIGDIAGGIGSIFGGGGGGKKMSKKQFYAQRDEFVALAEASGKPVNSLPGKPFDKFSHSVIKDSPFKDYTDEWKNFMRSVATYYPEFVLPDGSIAAAPIKPAAAVNQIKELDPAIDKALREIGAGVPNDQHDKLQLFADKIVGPGTATNLSGQGSEALSNAAIEFIATLADKKRAGETLPPIYDKIAGAALRTQDKLESKVRQGAEQKIGGFVMSNGAMIGIAAALLLVMVLTSSRK